MRGGGIGYIGAVIDHNEFSNSIVGDYETEEEGEDNYCPACARAEYGSKLSRKIIYVEQTKGGPKISKNPIIALGLDSKKEYRQCRECGNIYDLKDLPTTTTIMQDPDHEQEEIDRAYREGDFIPGPGPDRIKDKPHRKNQIPRKNIEISRESEERDKDKQIKGKIITKQIQRTKVKIVKKIPVPEKGNT